MEWHLKETGALEENETVGHTPAYISQKRIFQDQIDLLAKQVTPITISNPTTIAQNTDRLQLPHLSHHTFHYAPPGQQTHSFAHITFTLLTIPPTKNNQTDTMALLSNNRKAMGAYTTSHTWE